MQSNSGYNSFNFFSIIARLIRILSDLCISAFNIPIFLPLTLELSSIVALAVLEDCLYLSMNSSFLLTQSRIFLCFSLYKMNAFAALGHIDINQFSIRSWITSTVSPLSTVIYFEGWLISVLHPEAFSADKIALSIFEESNSCLVPFRLIINIIIQIKS